MIPVQGGVQIRRVFTSTDAQATLGYSLDAQKALVRKYVQDVGLQLISEHTEAESGFGPARLDKRPSLKRALQDCRRHRGRLVIATLDRLARNVVFIATLVETRIDFVALDIPDATPFMIHIYAAVAEEESRKKGEIVRAAMMMAKSLGADLGKEGRRRAAASRARAENLRPVIDEIRAAGIRGAHPMARELRRRGIPNTLNQRGIPNVLGVPWCAGVVRRLLINLGYFEPSKFPWCHEASAAARARADRLRGIIDKIQETRPHTDREIAQALNERGVLSARGGLWNSRSVFDLRKHYFRDAPPSGTKRATGR
jgi:DNA invertase Pin-like site-specific DNA recombinase